MSAATAACTPVAIVGAGPVGLSLALGLARQGVSSTLVERESATSEHSKAPAIQVRTREALRQWGVEEPMLDAGVLRSEITLHRPPPGRRPLATLDFGELADEADRPGVLILEQGRTERILLRTVQESGLCDVRFDAEAVDLARGRDGARLTVREGGAERSVDAAYVVGCDGASSFVRDALGLPFEGMTYATRAMLADVRVGDDRDGLPWPRVRTGRGGVTFTLRLGDRLWRIVRLETRAATVAAEDDPVAAGEIRRRVSEVLGAGDVEVVWASRYRIHRRSAPRFRAGPVLLAGDAAHVHSPAGGLGMNAGIQDAHNLAWRLAYALAGGEADRLLDTYDAERRAVVVGTVSRSTDVVTRLFLQTRAPARAAAVALLRAALAVPALRRRALRRASMIDLGYPPSPRAPAGRRLPDPPLQAPGGARVRLHGLLSEGPALIAVGHDRDLTAGVLAPTVVRVGAGGHADPTGALRRLLDGSDGWILVRPDRHVAWAGARRDGIEPAAARALGTRPGAASSVVVTSS